MKLLKIGALLGVLLLGTMAVPSSDAGYAYRQYYSGWRRHSSYSYYYRYYYYQPTYSYSGYKYHYVIYYPSTPRYYYYYNPYNGNYWGRFDTQGKPGEQYSLLAEKDRKDTLSAIPEAAFPKPAAMPNIPEAKENVAIEPPPVDSPGEESKNLPKDERK